MHDQASRLRNLVRRSAWPADAAGANLPRIITVAGGKWGVGCTTVATNVAAAIAQQGWRTVLIDVDRTAPTVARHVGGTPQTTLADVLQGRCDVHECLLPAGAGLHVLAGSNAVEPTKSLTTLYASLASHADLLVLDAGSATDAWAQTLWNDAERVLFVTAADALAIMECYTTLKTIWRKGMGPAVQVLVNRTGDAAIAADVHARLDRSCRRFLGLAVEPGAALPDSPSLSVHATSGTTLGGCQPLPVGPIFDRLAETLVNPAVALSRRPAA